MRTGEFMIRALMKNDAHDEEARWTTECLSPFIGRKRALLLFQVGYKKIDDLSKIPEYFVSNLFGFGPSSMEKLKQGMTTYGIKFRCSERPEFDGPTEIALAIARLREEFGVANKPPHVKLQEAESGRRRQVEELQETQEEAHSHPNAEICQ